MTWSSCSERQRGAAGARAAPDTSVVYLRGALEERPPRALRGELLLELGLAEKLIRDPAAAEHVSITSRMQLAQALAEAAEVADTSSGVEKTTVAQ